MLVNGLALLALIVLVVSCICVVNIVENRRQVPWLISALLAMSYIACYGCARTKEVRDWMDPESTRITIPRTPDTSSVKYGPDFKTITFSPISELGARWMVKTDQSTKAEFVGAAVYASKNGQPFVTAEVFILFPDGTTSTGVTLPK